MPLVQSQCGENYLTFDEEKHRYILNGKRVPGPTTFVKGGFPMGEALFNWNIKQGAEWAVATFEDEVSKLPKGKKLTKAKLDDIIKACPGAAKTKMEAAGSIGSIIHDYSYLIELGREAEAFAVLQKNEKHPDISKILKGVEKFHEWHNKNRDTLVASESIVASVSESYGGKFDRLAERPGVGLILSDFKTGKSIYVDQFIQLGAYVRAIREWLKMEVSGIEILRFGKEEGEFETKMITGEEIQAFEQQAILARRTYAFRLKWEADKRFAWKGRK